MRKKFLNMFIIAISLLILNMLSQNQAYAQNISRREFLENLLTARNINWYDSAEYVNNNAAGFILRTGIVTDTIEDLNAPVTRVEVLRWCIQALGLEFEAGIFNDMPLEFKDAKKLSNLERGYLYVASEMTPAIFAKDNYFRGQDFLTQNEMNAILERVHNASLNLKLEVVRHPLKGVDVLIHRDGVFTGVPSWQVLASNFKSKLQIDYARKFFKSQGFNLTLGTDQFGGGYYLRYKKTNDFNEVRKLTNLMQMREVKYKLVPSVANSNTSILPRYWVALFIDPELWNVRPMTSKGGANEFAVLSEIARVNNSKAIINAGFFGINKGRGFPIGLLRINGRHFSNSHENRGCIGWNNIDDAIFTNSSQDVINAYWNNVANIIQAGPLILREGVVSDVDEFFKPEFTTARHPRTATGKTSDGRWVFLIFDGRNGMHSTGATISELTNLAYTLNMTDALNLDGGGSSEIIINGKIYNFPSEGYERLISYALGIIPVKN